MYQLNLPRKYTAMAQIWISVLLIVLVTVFAFASPIISMDMTKNSFREDYENAVNQLSKDTPELENLHIPERIDVSGIDAIRSVVTFKNIIRLTIKGATADMTTTDMEEYQKLKDDFDKFLASDEGKETVVTSIAILSQVMDFSGEESNENSSSTGFIFIMFMKYLILTYIIAYMALFPFVFAIIALVNIIRGLSSIKKPEKVSGKVARALLLPLTFTIATMLFLKFFPNISLGSGLVTILTLAFISILVNLCVSRLRSYNELDLKYATLVQGSAIVEVVGYCLFFFNLLNIGLLRGFIDSFFNYVESEAKNINSINKVIEAYNSIDGVTPVREISAGFGFFIDVILMVAFAILALALALTVAEKIATHLGLTGNKRSSSGDTLSFGIVSVITCILPFVTGKLKNAEHFSVSLNDSGVPVVEKTKDTIFTLSSKQTNILTAMFIGALILLAAGIAFKVLKEKFCEGITEEREHLILCGNAPSIEETKAELKKVLEYQEKAEEKKSAKENTAEESEKIETAENSTENTK